MAVQTNDEIKGTEKEFLDLFNHLCYSRTAWQVWSDLMSAMACTIANVFETNPKRKADREKEYERCIKELGGDVEIPAKLFAIVTMALENNPDQDSSESCICSSILEVTGMDNSLLRMISKNSRDSSDEAAAP